MRVGLYVLKRLLHVRHILEKRCVNATQFLENQKGLNLKSCGNSLA